MYFDSIHIVQTLIDFVRRQVPHDRVANAQMMATPSLPGPDCHGSGESFGCTVPCLRQCWHVVETDNCHMSSSVLSCRGLGMLGQKRRLEACHIVVGCKGERAPEARGSGRWQCILDEKSRYTLNRRLTQSSLPRILGGQKVNM